MDILALLDRLADLDIEVTDEVKQAILAIDEEDEEEEETEYTLEMLAEKLIKCYSEKEAIVHILKGMHLNTSSRLFYQDHTLFERLANEQNAGLDRLGENIRTYGVFVPAGIKSLYQNSQIEQETTYDPTNPESYFEYLYQVYSLYCACLYECAEMCDKLNACGTCNIIQDEIELCEHHKDYLIKSVIG